ncbi:hypothetical protein BP00DRAFT_423939 [Aspergillus indologenus CBS 114.80]|uniref:Uncharacterized protein n=1 Tax=Aspergillus indologenus CBS 114.80 TaxID=1450541 RepID=A0A2V5IHF6_9EURO|nr:hypothetical protein BP00DRAFT_423939 [Aspergillus indologenus CBS 114.80]
MPNTRAQKRSRINIAGDACNRDRLKPESPGPSNATPMDFTPTPEDRGGSATERSAQVPARDIEDDLWTLPEIFAYALDNAAMPPPPMRDITGYIDEVIDRGRKWDPEAHERIKELMWTVGRGVSFARYTRMVDEVLAVDHPEMHRLDEDRVADMVAEYIMNIMTLIVAQCTPQASPTIQLHGVSELIRIGFTLASEGRNKAGCSWDHQFRVLIRALRSSMHMIIAGMQGYLRHIPCAKEFQGHGLNKQVEALNGMIEQSFGYPGTLDSVLSLLESDFDNTDPFTGAYCGPSGEGHSVPEDEAPSPSSGHSYASTEASEVNSLGSSRGSDQTA